MVFGAKLQGTLSGHYPGKRKPGTRSISSGEPGALKRWNGVFSKFDLGIAYLLGGS